MHESGKLQLHQGISNILFISSSKFTCLALSTIDSCEPQVFSYTEAMVGRAVAAAAELAGDPPAFCACEAAASFSKEEIVGLMSWLVEVGGLMSPPAAIIWARVDEWETGGSTGFWSTEELDTVVLVLVTKDKEHFFLNRS